jgi:hypothetical protein
MNGDLCARTTHGQSSIRTALHPLRSVLHVVRVDELEDQTILDPEESIKGMISLELIFVCRYWIDHLRLGRVGE